MNLYAFAVAVVSVWFNKVEAAARPIDRKTASAELQGMYVAANRLGLGFTETHVSITFQDAIKAVESERGERPGYNASNNSERKAWDEALARKFEAVLGTLV